MAVPARCGSWCRSILTRLVQHSFSLLQSTVCSKSSLHQGSRPWVEVWLTYWARNSNIIGWHFPVCQCYYVKMQLKLNYRTHLLTDLQGFPSTLTHWHRQWKHCSIIYCCNPKAWHMYLQVTHKRAETLHYYRENQQFPHGLEEKSPTQPDGLP